MTCCSWGKEGATHGPGPDKVQIIMLLQPAQLLSAVTRTFIQSIPAHLMHNPFQVCLFETKISQSWFMTLAWKFYDLLNTIVASTDKIKMHVIYLWLWQDRQTSFNMTCVQSNPSWKTLNKWTILTLPSIHSFVHVSPPSLSFIFVQAFKQINKKSTSTWVSLPFHLRKVQCQWSITEAGNNGQLLP